MINNGCTKKTFFCPSTSPQYSDKENFVDPYPNSLWNFNFPPGTSEDNAAYFHITGYIFAVNGGKLDSRYQNAKLTSESHGSFVDRVADRVLIADVMISGNNSYPANAAAPFQGITGGFIKPHLSAHLKKGVPIGGNSAYKDGHAQWKKFVSPPGGFSVPGGSTWLSTEDTYTMARTPGGPYFWW
jgi:hypothetical protein